MTANQICFCTQSTGQIKLSNPLISLTINSQTGNWEDFIYLPLNLSILAGQQRRAIEIGLDQNWLPDQMGWQVKQIDCHADDKGAYCNLLLQCSEIDVWDNYTISSDQALISRKIKVIYRGNKKKTFWGALFRLPAISLGDAKDCVVLVPGQSTISRIPLAEQAIFDQYPQPLDDLKYRQGIGKTPFGPLESTPDFTPGIVGLHNSQKKMTLLSWFYSKDDAASLATEGFLNALAVTHHHRVEGWADVDREYECGTQYIAIQTGSIGDAFDFIRSSWSMIEGIQPHRRSIDTGHSLIYETSAQMHGGISRLSEKLPGLQKMGVNFIYLLPIWLGIQMTPQVFASDRPLDYRLDPRWQRKSVPHRIISHDILDPNVGTAEDIRQFVSHAHSLHIRVLFDFVFHGVAPGSPLITEKPEWFQRNLHGDMFASHQWIPSFSLDWANPEVRDYFIQFALRNFHDFDIDGYRIDAPFEKESNWNHGIPWRSGASGFGGVRLLRELREKLREIKPDSVLLCEHSGPIWDGICDVCNDDAFLRMCLKVAQSQMKATDLQTWLFDRLSVGVPGSLRVLSIENHNSTRVNPSSLAYRGSPITRALFTICCFSGGIPLIWDGQERGQEQFYRDIAHLRQEHPALQHGAVNLSANADSSDIFVVLRLCSEENLIVVVNCGSRWDRVEINLPSSIIIDNVSAVWNNAEGQEIYEEFHSKNHSIQCTVEPYSSYLFRLE